MSGSITAQYGLPSEQIDLAKRQSRVFGGPEDSIESILEYFKTVRLQEFVLFNCNDLFMYRKLGLNLVRASMICMSWKALFVVYYGNLLLNQIMDKKDF